ncbi:hypothetical protein XENTR_v10020838 [Xenopus tropicalis]|nr:hypothetical protein XENTR_v10020838 [Xenopus tropicalis]
MYNILNLLLRKGMETTHRAAGLYSTHTFLSALYAHLIEARPLYPPSISLSRAASVAHPLACPCTLIPILQHPNYCLFHCSGISHQSKWPSVTNLFKPVCPSHSYLAASPAYLG